MEENPVSAGLTEEATSVSVIVEATNGEDSENLMQTPKSNQDCKDCNKAVSTKSTKSDGKVPVGGRRAKSSYRYWY